MNKKISRLVCAVMCCAALPIGAQTSEKITASTRLFEEGHRLFEQQNYAAASSVLKSFVNNPDANNGELLNEAEYMIVCSAYELKERNCLNLLRRYIDEHPDTPHANRLYALMGSYYFYNGQMDEALVMFNSSELELLSDEERDRSTYQQALCYMKTGNLKEAAIRFEILKEVSDDYDEDCTYHLSYIRYTQRRYDEAIQGFNSLLSSKKYSELAPYYIAEIQLNRKEYSAAKQTASSYLAQHAGNANAAEMQRIYGEASYKTGDYYAAENGLGQYVSSVTPARRDALYMLGMSYYNTNVYSKAAATLSEVNTVNDALTQNAELHMGLSYLQTGERNKARMAFEQAAASSFDMDVKEQAAYNYALCLHESNYSGFGESVYAFENFLNDFPNSKRSEAVSGYLVDVYMSTRSYDAALQSIERIKRPSSRIMEAKQKILYNLGTQKFANADFESSIDYMTRSIAIGQYDSQTKANALFWRGEAYYRQEDPTHAKSDLTQFVQQTANRGEELYALAHYDLGYIAFDKKDYTTARGKFLNFLELTDNSNTAITADACNRIGDCYLQSRNFGEAKSYYTRAGNTDAATGDYSDYQLALVEGLQKNYSGKIAALDRLVSKYPDSPYAIDAIYEKGHAYVLAGNNTQAIKAFNELQTKYKESPVARKAAAEAALLYYQDGNYNQAIAAYKNVIENYPGSDEARMAMQDLKSIYVDQNRIDEYAALAASMPGTIRFDATEQDSLTYMAAEKIYMRGETESAKQSFNKYLQTFPDGAFTLNAHYYLCLIGNQQKSDEMVLTHSEKLMEYPDNPFLEEVLLMRGEVQFNKRDYAGALTTYRTLKDKSTQSDIRIGAETGMLRAAYMTKDDVEVINAATALLGESKLTSELANEARYYRAKALLNQKADTRAMSDLKELAKDTRNLYGAEARYLVGEELYKANRLAEAESELLNYIDESTPHIYWLARSFVLLSDVYVAEGKSADARQYLLSLQQNYTADDDIQTMIKTRLEQLNK
jgi:TolA-binding protein